NLWVVERDLHWNPVPAGQANLPGPYAPQPPSRPVAEPAPGAASKPGQQPSTTGQSSAAVAGHDGKQPSARRRRDKPAGPIADRPGPDALPQPGMVAGHPSPSGVGTGMPRPSARPAGSRRTPPRLGL